jgi:hypothetical protein
MIVALVKVLPSDRWMIGLKNGKNFGVVGRQKRGKKDGKICG